MSPRAVWVWTRPEVHELLSWCQEHDVAAIFLSVPPNLAYGDETDDDLRWIRQVVRTAKDAGIEVSALGGDPGWVGHPAAGPSWLRAVLATRLFHSVHLDIEPWARDDWDPSDADAVGHFVELLRTLAAACPLPLEADIPFWLHEVLTASGQPLDAVVMQIVDSVTVLSFRNTVTGPDSITDVAAHALSTATRLGIPCRLAVETNDLGPDPESRKQTFFGATQSALAQALEEVDAVEAGAASYNGIGVEDYPGWRAL